MKVVIVFEYPEVIDPNSSDADAIVEHLSKLTAIWSDDLGAIVYVDEVEGEQALKVVIVFEYSEVIDPNSSEADAIVEHLSELTTRWSDDLGATVYVDEVEGEQA
jgi:5'-3' exonuclease